MNEHTGFTDEHIPLLAKWSLRSLPEYQQELAQRSQVAQVVNAAVWLAEQMGLDVGELEEAGKDAEAVIRTALLAGACKRTEMPDWVAFEKMVGTLRKKHAASAKAAASLPALAVPKDLPPAFTPAVEAVRQSVLADLSRILDSAVPVRKLFDQTPAFMGRYFWLEDSLHEVDHFDRSISAQWDKATGGHSDDGSLLTLFVCVAAGSAPKTVLTEKAAAALVRRIRKSGFQPELARQFILHHAPAPHQDGYLQLWDSFVDEAQSTLLSDFDYALKDALALLRRECSVGP